MELVSGQVWGQLDNNYRNGEGGGGVQRTDQPKSPTFVGLK